MVAGDLARLFLAVPLTEDARQAISAVVVGAAPRGLPGRVVRPQNWHLTLRFLGGVDAVTADRVTASLDDSDLGSRFEIRWGRFGAFPRARKANVLWVGVERGADRLAELAAGVEDAVEAAGLDREERPFRSHLTLSRIRPHQDVTHLVEAAPPVGVTMGVDRVVLYRSHLGRGGARYEAIEEFPLG